MLRSFELENENNHENLEEQQDIPYDYYFLQTTAWIIRSNYQIKLQATRCQLVFDRYMIYNIAFRAYWLNKYNKKETKENSS
jgi:hypothetical protein